MDSESLFIGGLIAIPGVLAIAALITGIVFFTKAKTSSSSLLLNVVGAAFVLFALGVGSCYAMMWMG